jgi:broad specificity phosphatase PhoE
MAMPEDLYLIRHAESEGNVANEMAKKGDNSAFTEEFLNRHSSQWRLTDEGRRQAVTAGEYLRKEMKAKLGRCYTSDYIRAMETAALLKIPDAKWMTEFYLRERDWGIMDTMPHAERKEKYARSMKEKKEHPLLWKPINGTSIADLCLRIDRMCDTLHRECSEMSVGIVCHGEVMWAFRTRLERIPFERFNQLDVSKDPHDRIHNCQIIHYTRRNPKSEKLEPYLGWFRSVCPWDLKRSANIWQKIERQKFSNEALLKRVEAIQPIYR